MDRRGRPPVLSRCRGALAAQSVRAGRVVIAVAGSGRTADAIAAAARGEESCGERARALARGGLLRAVELADRAALGAALDEALGAGSRP